MPDSTPFQLLCSSATDMSNHSNLDHSVFGCFRSQLIYVIACSMSTTVPAYLLPPVMTQLSVISDQSSEASATACSPCSPALHRRVHTTADCPHYLRRDLKHSSYESKGTYSLCVRMLGLILIFVAATDSNLRTNRPMPMASSVPGRSVSNAPLPPLPLGDCRVNDWLCGVIAKKLIRNQ